MNKAVEKLVNKKILVWGYGREGKSTESFFKDNNISDSVEIFEGKLEEIDVDKYDYIFKSPGIVMEEDHPKFTSQTQLFLEIFRDQVVGITGTKGKSTTSAMLVKVLGECSGKKSILLGNIGSPCLDYYNEIDEDTIIVFEMSCHQLAHTTVDPHVAVFLNLFEEHLDYYGTMDKYFNAKANVTKYQQEGDYFLRGENVPDIKTNANIITIEGTGKESFDLHILGGHNQINANFVNTIACDIYGCDKAKVKESIESFTGLPHRLKLVGTVDDVRFYDDSISTIPQATISAVNSVKDVGTVLVGGMDRNIDYEVLVDFIPKTTNVTFICMYESGLRIYEEVKDCANTCYVEDLEAAVKKAKEITKKGQACVLSPAAASYGYFKNFEERGDVFTQLVLEK